MAVQRTEITDYATKESIPFPCELCTGISAVRARGNIGGECRMLTSQEFCDEMGICTSTVDWDAFFGRE